MAEMTKQEFVDTISRLPGVGKAKAEALWEAGFTSVDQLKESSAEELAEQVDGVGPKLADAILQGVADLEAPEPEPEVEVVESLDEGAQEEEEPAEIVEQEEHVAKPKPSLDDETEELLKLRNWMAAKRQKFVRRNWYQFKKLGKDHPWRRSRGNLAKQRRGKKHVPKRVKVGFRGPKEVRGLHPSGFEEVLVHNADGLEGIDPDTQAARIASGVGKRKRQTILDKADEAGIRVLNPGRGS